MSTGERKSRHWKKGMVDYYIVIQVKMIGRFLDLETGDLGKIKDRG